MVICLLKFCGCLSVLIFQPKSRQRLTASEDREDMMGDDEPKRGRGRRRKKRNFADIDDKKIEDDETPPVLSVQKQIHMSINLSEINRKLYTVNPVFWNLEINRKKILCKRKKNKLDFFLTLLHFVTGLLESLKDKFLCRIVVNYSKFLDSIGNSGFVFWKICPSGYK